MSVAGGDNELETAVVQHNTSSNVQDEDAEQLEASEDRLIHFVRLEDTAGGITSEVSFSSSFTLNANGAKDETASGVLAVTRSNSAGGVLDYTSAPPTWDAGEELHLHTNNTTGTSQQTRVIVGYEPIGEFRRDRLRNR